jgi:hypothetical protein
MMVYDLPTNIKDTLSDFHQTKSHFSSTYIKWLFKKFCMASYKKIQKKFVLRISRLDYLRLTIALAPTIIIRTIVTVSWVKSLRCSIFIFAAEAPRVNTSRVIALATRRGS